MDDDAIAVSDFMPPPNLQFAFTKSLWFRHYWAIPKGCVSFVRKERGERGQGKIGVLTFLTIGMPPYRATKVQTKDKMCSVQIPRPKTKTKTRMYHSFVLPNTSGFCFGWGQSNPVLFFSIAGKAHGDRSALSYAENVETTISWRETKNNKLERNKKQLQR
jgi:hypothetical protein